MLYFLMLYTLYFLSYTFYLMLSILCFLSYVFMLSILILSYTFYNPILPPAFLLKHDVKFRIDSSPFVP